MRRFLRRLFCRHQWRFLRNIHGDEIILRNYMRSVWKCEKVRVHTVPQVPCESQFDRPARAEREVSEGTVSDGFYRGRQFREHITGQNFIRDTAHPCEFFEIVTFGAGDGRCEGDGHYMCQECAHHVARRDALLNPKVGDK